MSFHFMQALHDRLIVRSTFQPLELPKTSFSTFPRKVIITSNSSRVTPSRIASCTILPPLLPSEPTFLPKLQVYFVDFPFLHFSFKLEVLNLRNLLRLFVRFNKQFFFFCKKNQFFEFSWITGQICIYL